MTDPDPEGSLQSVIARRRAQFVDKLGKDFETKRRGVDMRRTFERAIRKQYPGLAVIWLQKHSHMAKVLFTTYDTRMLHKLIDRYAGSKDLHAEHGISFDSFYWQCPKLATELALAEAKAKAVAVRQVTAQQREQATEPTATEVEKFTSSAFFKKLPAIFQAPFRKPGGPG